MGRNRRSKVRLARKDITSVPNKKSNTVTLLYSNTRGLTKSKIEAIQEEARNDAFIIGNEWNKKKSDASLVASYFGKMAILESCDDFCYSEGNRVPILQKKQEIRRN